MDVSPIVGKFYGSFNDILRVVGIGKNEMVSLRLNKSYCLPHLVYCCESWHMRRPLVSYVLSVLLDQIVLQKL